MKRFYFLFMLGIVARIVFSEGQDGTKEERELIASCIKNRVNNPNFGSPKKVWDIELSKVEFPSINRSVWKQATLLNDGKVDKDKKIMQIWEECENIERGGKDYPRTPNIVYFHRKDKEKPKVWPEVEKYKTTENFIFYKIKQ